MNATFPDTSTLATIASIITAFSVAMLVFRIQRELQMKERLESNWIPWADRLLLGAGLISLLAVILPLVSAHPTSDVYRLIPPAACSVVVILVAGYTFAILAHYRLFLGGRRKGSRENPEPGERIVVIATVIGALIGFAWTIYLHRL